MQTLKPSMSAHITGPSSASATGRPHATVKLLVPAGTIIDDGELRRVGRGRVKDWTGASALDGRRIRLGGEIRNAEVRVHRGGVAILSLLRSRRSLSQVRKAHREGRLSPAA